MPIPPLEITTGNAVEVEEGAIMDRGANPVTMDHDYSRSAPSPHSHLGMETEPVGGNSCSKEDSAATIARLSAENNELRKKVAELTCELAAVRQQATEEAQKAALRHQELMQHLAPSRSGCSEEKPAPAQPGQQKRPRPQVTPDQPGSDDERAKTRRTGEADEMASTSKEATKVAPQVPSEAPHTEPSKIPSVVLRKQENRSHVSRLLKEKMANYTKAKMIGEGSIAITPATAADYRLITKDLEADKQEYHTYSLQEDRNLRAVIRGIPTGVAEEEIKANLVEQGFTVLSVHRMTSRRDKRTMPLVLVQVPTSQSNLLQKFGHGQSRCTAQHKCVKCGADHETGRCVKPREEPARWANCTGPYPASYRGCPKYPKPAKKTAGAKKPATTAGTQAQPPKPSAAAVPGKSFAAAAAGTRKPPAAASQAQKGPQVDLAGLVGALSQFQAIISELQKVAQIMPLLQEFLSRLEIDVVALQETRLAENIRTKIPGYVVYRQDRNRRGGGVAVAIKRGIDHYMLQVPQLNTIEAVAVGIRTSRYGEVAVASCYHPPGRTILEQDIEALLTVGPRVIAIGDFNAKAQDWNSRQLNPSGAALRRFLENTVDVVAIGPEEPTFDGQGRFAPDVLDIALLKAIPAETDITSHHEGSSDHNPVLLTMGDPTPQGDIIVKRNTDWANFRAEMQRSTAIPQIETTDDLEAAVVSLETDIRTALERSTTETREVRQANYIDEIPLEAQQLIRDRRAARRRALRSGAPEHRRIANQLSRRVRAALDEHRQETWRRFVESLNPRDNSLWKTQKALKTRRRPVPPLHGEQGIVHTNRDKAEAFADSLELQCRENQLDDEDEEHTALMERRAMRIDQTPEDEEILEGEKSTYRDLEAGVPQGTVLSPHLFNIYTSDLPRTDRTSMSLYADDTVLAAQSTEAATAGRYLQRATDELEEWCNRWKVAINADKSTGIIFTRRPTQRRAQEVTINGEAIQLSNNVKYLGVHLDRTMTWGHHVAETIRKAKIARARLYPLLCGESRLNLRNKLLLIKSIIQPQLTYASTAWGHACKTHLKRIQAVENIALRTAVSAPWFVRNRDLHRDLEWTPVQEVIKTCQIAPRRTDGQGNSCWIQGEDN
ncbi:hypothetical protein NQ315_012020 [Exocentrus adspersus]|uniref:Reverse transcriptase domain-containing protein n=1 Tax=Exocentrus adspersus TaxID=1586481 RepID=A0AAV8VI42_9CUCU|nr:hypothetical protein NQ315_012020 [Exocentrus adspersus]